MQRGNISLRGKCWLLQYREPVLVDGKVMMRSASKKLATYCQQYRTAESVQSLADLILAPINAKTAQPESDQTLAAFMEHVYLPHCVEELKPSTSHSYAITFKLLQPHLNGLKLRDARTSHVEDILRAVAAKQLAQTTLANARNFLSGGFRYAIRTDRFTRGNPVREVKTPKGARPQNTHAYTLDEVTAMLRVLPEPARTAILVAALTGLRSCEIRALSWTDFSGPQLNVSRSAWRTHVGETKTAGSAAPVPVVPVLRNALLAHKKRTTNRQYIFAGETGKPLVLANVTRRVILPALRKAEIPWHGWHAFRRGVGSVLHELGVPDKDIQEILRHANVATTQRHYIKVTSSASTAAMKKLEAAFRKASRRKVTIN
jgi:integrase